MALIRCPECKKKISDTCKTCPHCGYTLDEGETIQQIYEEIDKHSKPASGPMAAAIILVILEVVLLIVANAVTMSQGFAIFVAIIFGISTIGSFSGIFNCASLIGKTNEKGKAIVGLVFSIIGTIIGLTFWIGFLIGCSNTTTALLILR